MDKEILEPEDVKKALQKFCNSQTVKISKYEILNFHNPFQGLVGEHFTLRVDFNPKNHPQSCDFFVKTLSSNPSMFSFSKELQVYEKESFFYQLLDEFETNNIDTSFAPRGLFFKPHVTVLEDLSKNYKGTPKRTLLDLAHCEKCLETVAKFHASSMLYERKTGKDLNGEKILEDSFTNEEKPLPKQWMSAALEAIVQLIDVVLVEDPRLDDFKNKLMEVLTLEPTKGLLSSILHADLWTSNFLYLYENEIPVDAKLVDFQLVKYGPVEQDVVEFLMTNTTLAFRVENFDHLVSHYYKKLTQCLTSCEIPALGDFVTSCNNFKLGGKIHAVVDHSYTFMADEIYGDVMKSEQSLKKFVFEERSKYILEAYNKDAEFRKMLSEDVLELRDLLFS